MDAKYNKEEIFKIILKTHLDIVKMNMNIVEINKEFLKNIGDTYFSDIFNINKDIGKTNNNIVDINKYLQSVLGQSNINYEYEADNIKILEEEVKTPQNKTNYQSCIKENYEDERIDENVRNIISPLKMQKFSLWNNSNKINQEMMDIVKEVKVCDL